MKSANIRNSYRTPRVIFSSPFDAQKFAAYINHSTKSYCASYREFSGDWIVEANIKLPEFVNYYNCFQGK